MYTELLNNNRDNAVFYNFLSVNVPVDSTLVRLSLEWSEVEQDLQSVSDHLNSLLNDMIKSFSFSENQTFRAYAMLYDQSAGDPGKVCSFSLSL